MAVLFDTRAYHRTLTDAGVPLEQADAHTRAIGLALDGGVATQQGLANVETSLRAEIVALRTELKADIADVRTELKVGLRDVKIWTGSVMAALLGILFAALKLFP